MATALYRRYRPESFAEVIGQDHVTTPLRRALRAGRIGHAYLFSGPRGCGKTTSARILARCLNCAQGPTDVPCGTCDSCRDLANGGSGSLDVVEIDAASHGGVDDARELRERASFAPVRDRFKVFIIDEAHMVTSAGFNALLKLVEEPPEHVKFVFATTEPDKVIGTIRSRTHHYPFRLIPPQVLGPYLEEVCASEQVQVGAGVMPLVVRAGGGSARDSMSVLDQLMAGAGDDGLDFPTAIALLGFTDTALLDSAITAVAERDAAALYSAVEHVLATGHEPRRFVEDLLERMRDLIVLAAVPDRGADLLPQVPADELESMRGQASLFAPADLSQCGDLVHATLSTMSGATSPRLHLELLAARLVLRDERAALAAGDGPAPAVDHRGSAPAGRGGQPGAAPAAATGASGAREEARRIAQEKVEASRQSRGDRAGADAAATGAASAGTAAVSVPGAPAPQATASAPAPQETAPAPTSNAPAAAAEPAPAQSAQAPWGDVAQQTSAERPAISAAQGSAAQGSAAQNAAPQDAAPQNAAPQNSAVQDSAPQNAAPQDAAPQQPPTGSGGLDADQVRTHWSAILDELQQIRRPSWALISQNGHVNGAHDSTLVIGFRTDGLVNAFHRGTAAQNLADAVRRILHLEVMIEAVVGEDPGPGGGGAAGPGGAGAPGSGGGTAGPSGGGAAGPGAAGPGAAGPGSVGPGAGNTPAQRPGGQNTSARETPARVDASPAADGSDQAGQAGHAGQAGPTGQAGQAAPARWGDAVSAMAPREAAPAPAAQEPQAVSAGQRASERAMQAAARAAQAGRSGPATEYVEDFPPEPDDPFPPDPQDDYQPRPRDPQQAAAAHGAAAGPSGGARWSDALSTGDERSGGEMTAATDPGPAARPAGSGPAGSGSAGSAAGSAPAAAGGLEAPVAGASASGPAPSGEIPVVDDEGRDNVPPEESRTYGQNALRRALAEGRVVHSRPAQNAAAPAMGGTPTEHPGAPAGIAPGQGEDGSDAGRPALQAVPPMDPSSAAGGSSADAAPTSPGPGESASARAAASWGTTAAVPGPQAPPSSSPAGTPSFAGAPSSGVAPSAATPAAATSAAAAPSAPRSGAALVREAAQATRDAGQRGGGRRGNAPAEPVADVDPTGGATRDDDNAVVGTRNGREVVEKLLGGKVLEIIDENRNY